MKFGRRRLPKPCNKFKSVNLEGLEGTFSSIFEKRYVTKKGDVKVYLMESDNRETIKAQVAVNEDLSIIDDLIVGGFEELDDILNNEGFEKHYNENNILVFNRVEHPEKV